jgi:hypothetical protein
MAALPPRKGEWRLRRRETIKRPPTRFAGERSEPIRGRAQRGH